MRRPRPLLLAALLVPSLTQAEESSYLESTSAPAAAVLVGASSMEVERPGSLSDVTATVTDQISGGELPDDFALELAPYWLLPHKGLSVERSLYCAGGDAALQALASSRGGQHSPSIADKLHCMFAEDLSLSLATTNDDDDTDMELAVGASTTLIWGREHLSKQRHVEAWQELADNIAALERYARLKSEWIGDWLWAHPTKDMSAAESAFEEARTAAAGPARVAEEDPTTFNEDDGPIHGVEGEEEAQASGDQPEGQAWMTEYSDSELTKMHQAVLDAFQQRRGFALDLSAGLASAFPGMNLADSGLSRTGLWLNPAWLWDSASLVGLVGVFGHELEGEWALGQLRYGLQATVAWERLALSVEDVERLQYCDGSLTRRMAVGLDVRLSEKTWVSTTVGSEYPWDQEGSFFSLFSFTFAEGDKRSLEAAQALSLDP